MTPNYRRFKTYMKSKDKRPDTIKEYIKRLKELPQDLIHDPKKLNDYIYNVWGKTPSVIDLTTAAVRLYYKSIGKKEWVLTIEKPGWKSGEKKEFLSENQVKKVRAIVAPYPILELMFDLYYETGIRRSILLYIKLKDIDYDKHVIYISKNYIGNKAKKDYLVYVNKSWLDGLKEYLEQREKEDIFVTDIRRDATWIKRKKVAMHDAVFEFWFVQGKKLKRYKDPRTFLTKLFNKIGELAGVKLGPHIVRHTVGTETYAVTKDILQTRDQLGQKTTKPTERYTHQIEDIKKVHDKRFGK